MQSRRTVGLVAIGACCMALAYLAGIYSYAKNLGPVELLRTVKRHLLFQPEERTGKPTVDAFSRLTSYPGKVEVPCPVQTDKTKVLLLIGQSNAANNGGQRYVSAHGDKVINYYAGRCFLAASPLLGTTGEAGEPWTLLGNKLVASGLADRVVLVASAIGGVPVRRWKEGGDANGVLQSVLDELKSRYLVTQILWHQGESDFAGRTAQGEYVQMFTSMVDSIRRKGVKAPIFVSVATKCGLDPDWRPENPVSMAQRSLPDNGRKIFPGVNTDAMLGPEDRYEECHLSATGQEKFAAAWVEEISKVQ